MRALALFLALAGLLQPLAAHAQATKFRVGICARTVSTGVGAPFAVAMKMGWFKQEGLEVEVVPLREAAVRIVYEIFPETRPTGKDEATAVREDVTVLQARVPHFLLEPAGVRRWGESSEVNYRDYIDFLLKWGVLKQKVETGDLITNDLIEVINRLDAAKIATEAKAYTYAR